MNAATYLWQFLFNVINAFRTQNTTCWGYDKKCFEDASNVFKSSYWFYAWCSSFIQLLSPSRLWFPQEYKMGVV